MAKNIVRLLEDLPSAQHGYFTRSQAAAANIEDFDLTRATHNGFVDRVGHGVYKVAGSGHDPFAAIRVAWLRLAPNLGPRERTVKPSIWVSHESAAHVHGFGVFIADTPSFIAVDRLQANGGVKIHRRSKGLERSEWTVRSGFAVTSIERTAADLAAAGIDGGHLGRFMADALSAGATDRESLQVAIGTKLDLDALIDMNTSTQ